MYKVTNSNKLQIHTSVFINLNTGYVMIDHQISLCLISQTSCRQINITWWHKVNTAHNIHNGNNSSNYSSDHTNKYNLVV